MALGTKEDRLLSPILSYSMVKASIQSKIGINELASLDHKQTRATTVSKLEVRCFALSCFFTSSRSFAHW